MDILRIGLVSVSDRASGGVYQDKGIPALENGWLRLAGDAVQAGNPADPR